MFEKEAEEYANRYVSEGVDELKIKVIKGHWQDGAEFGYNKAKDKIEALEERCEIANDEIIRLQKIIEWHYVKDGDLPKDESRVWLYFGVNDYNDGQFIRGRFWCDSCGWFDVEEVIAWKEIVLPKE